MNIKDAFKSYSFENTKTYLFKNEINGIKTIEVSRFKSGYEVIFKDECNNIYKRTDGLKNNTEVQKYITNI